MVEFLSPGWFDELRRAAAAASVPADLSLTVQEVVVDGDTERAYAIRMAGGRVEVLDGRVADADVSFTQDLATAREIAAGRLAAQTAFMDGRLRVGGDLGRLLESTPLLAGLADVFRGARDAVAW